MDVYPADSCAISPTTFLFLTCIRIFWAMLIEKTQGTDLEMWSSLLHIADTCVALLYQYRQREQCRCDLFSEIYEHILFTFHLNFMCLSPLRLSCVFLNAKWARVHKDLFLCFGNILSVCFNKTVLFNLKGYSAGSALSPKIRLTLHKWVGFNPNLYRCSKNVCTIRRIRQC